MKYLLSLLMLFPAIGLAQSDFQARCAAAGVVKCVGFDTAADITGSWGVNPQGVVITNACCAPTIDTAVKADGAGSMRMNTPANSGGSVAGNFFANFSNDYSVRFGENTDFYFQYRERFDTNYVTTAQGKTTMKQGMVGTGSTATVPASSCTDLEIVSQNNFQRGVPQLYQNCGRYEPLEQPSGGSDYLIQNARPNPPGCWHYNTTGNCVPYVANEWMTFQLHVHPGPLQLINNQWWYTNSHIDEWIGREGQASVQTINFGPYNIGPIADNQQKYGQVWFMMYSGGSNYTLASTAWVDSLIVSTSKIADPGGTITPTPDPCTTLPVVSVTEWPNQPAGAQTFRFSTSQPLNTVHITTDLTSAAFTDTRSCSVTILKPPPLPPGDTTPPQAYFVTSNNVTFTGNDKVIDVHVTDNVGVTRLELYRPGFNVPICTMRETKLAATTHCRWQASSIPKGTYVLTAYAYDAAENKSAAVSLTVIKK